MCRADFVNSLSLFCSYSVDLSFWLRSTHWPRDERSIIITVIDITVIIFTVIVVIIVIITIIIIVVIIIMFLKPPIASSWRPR